MPKHVEQLENVPQTMMLAVPYSRRLKAIAPSPVSFSELVNVRSYLHGDLGSSGCACHAGSSQTPIETWQASRVYDYIL